MDDSDVLQYLFMLRSNDSIAGEQMITSYFFPSTIMVACIHKIAYIWVIPVMQQFKLSEI